MPTSEALPTENDLPLGRWVSLTDVLPMLRERMSYNDGGRFVLTHWDCKYIDIRVDMRFGYAYLTPGNTAPLAPEGSQTQSNPAAPESGTGAASSLDVTAPPKCIVYEGTCATHSPNECPEPKE